MEEWLNDIVSINRSALCSFLIRNDISDYNFQLWRSVIKPIILDRHLAKIESMFIDMDVFISHIRCRHCESQLRWVDLNVVDADEAFFMCVVCPDAVPILKCNIEETANILIELLEKHHPQIIASVLKLVFISGNFLNSISPPAIADNPFETFKSMCEKSPNALRMGGIDAVIIADIYENYDISEFPILYIADTVSIPTRYFLHALKFRSEIFNSKTNQNTMEHNDGVDIPKYQEEYLVKELTEIANLYLKSGSYLVLGRRLQHLISKDYYIYRKNHNLSIVPFSTLCPPDDGGDHTNGSSRKKFDLSDNLEKIVGQAVKICNIVQTVLKNDLNRNHEVSYEYLQKHLTAVIWMLTFSDMPFEAMLYHIIQLNKT